VRGASRLYNDLQGEIDRALGIEQQYIVCAVPQPRHFSTPMPASKEEQTQYVRQLSLSLTLDDYKWNADKFNEVGEACRRAGLLFCFHNEGFDFRKTGKVVHYDELLRLTDKSLVRLEMDCYWVARAGQDVIGYLDRYANRIEMLHLADLARGTAPTTDIENAREAEIPLGTGFIDWAAVLSRTRQAGVRHYFVEDERSKNRDKFASVAESFHFLERFR
jgi:sugar phosphate isomerase/epimerase